MDTKGGKPVATREKQRPLGAKTKTHFSGRIGSVSIEGIQKQAINKAPVLSKQAQPFQQAVQSQAPVVQTPPQVERAAFPVPKYAAPERPKRLVHKRASKFKIIMRATALCLVIFVTGWGLLLWNGYVRFHKVFHGSSIVAALSSKPTLHLAPLNGESDGRVNILLTGIGGPGKNKPNVTNSIMLLSVDTTKDTATVVDLPLDLWVQQPATYSGKQQKLDLVYQNGMAMYQSEEYNSANTSGAEQLGLADLDQVVEHVTGESINYNVLMNFQGFQQAVDALGGVTVNVPAELKDPSLASYNHGNSVIAEPGIQTLSGEQALLYVRSHETTSSFASLQRELQLVMAIKDKLMSAGTLTDPEEINVLTTSLDNNFYTDLSTQGAERFYQIMQKIGDDNVKSSSLFDSTQTILTASHMNGEAVLLPAAGFNNYGAIQEYVRGLMPSDELAGEAAPITVMGKTQAGVQLSEDFLKSYGYNITTAEITSQSVSRLTIVDLSNGSDPITLKALESHYDVRAITTLPVGVDIPPGSAKFVIIEP